MQAKTMRDSHTVTTLILLPHQANASGNVHGGEIIKIMDNTAGIASIRHAEGEVVTARIDELIFHKPVHIGDIIECRADVAYAGRTSMQVYVCVDICPRVGETTRNAISAFFTMVAIDDAHTPRPIAPIIAQEEWEHTLMELGQARYEYYRKGGKK